VAGTPQRRKFRGTGGFGGPASLRGFFLRPILFLGPAKENRLLGFSGIDRLRKIDDRLTSQVGRIAASQVAFYYGNAVVKTTLDSPVQEPELDRPAGAFSLRLKDSGPEEIQTWGRTIPDYKSLELSSGIESFRTGWSVLKSYDQATAFFSTASNRLLLGVGIGRGTGRQARWYFLSHIPSTRSAGKIWWKAFAHWRKKATSIMHLDAHVGGDEVAEVTRAFIYKNRIARTSLPEKPSQEVTGTWKTAGHDWAAWPVLFSHEFARHFACRHRGPTAEFSCARAVCLQNQAGGGSIRKCESAVNQMTDLIDSLLGVFLAPAESLRPN